MTSEHLLGLHSPFNFLNPDPLEVRRLFPEVERSLPLPDPIFLADEEATPIVGFPVRRSRAIEFLGQCLRDYLESEERAQVATLQKRTDLDIRAHQLTWERYRSSLTEISQNIMTASYGRSFPQVFWLYHSLDVSRVLKGTANRVRQADLEIGKRQGDALRYVVLSRYLEKVVSALYDLASKVAISTHQSETLLFPALLTSMRDNVLIFTEDHVSSDLNELVGYFRGYLKIDGRDLLYRMAHLRQWHKELLAEDSIVQAAATELLGSKDSRALAAEHADRLLMRQGYLAFLAGHSSYSEERFFSRRELRLWSALVHRLQEFELLNACRRRIVEVKTDDGQYTCDARTAARLGAGNRPLELNAETRALDFGMPFIVDPEVSRAGLIYDITDFSAIVSVIRLSERKTQDDSFRHIFLFQNRIDRIAAEWRLRLEKYLGDGAFYSGRNVMRMLRAALQIQRAYREAIDKGFPFDQGMRIALNFGTYRLLPFGGGSEPARYEVFGHGLVELSRLVSGKKSLDFQELRSVLVARGYDESRVNAFFAPIAKIHNPSASSARKPGTFHTELTEDGALINEGMVVTERYLEELEKQFRPRPLFHIEHDSRRFVAFDLPSSDETVLTAGFRRLGVAALKGLGNLPVYELVDANQFKSPRRPLFRTDLLSAVNETYTSTLAKSS